MIPVLVTLFLAWFLFLRPASLGGPAGYILISGQSMEPTLSPGDLVVVLRQETYAVGDIIAFRVEGGGTVIHRIVGGSAVEGFVVKGDNNPGPDLWRPRPEEVLGRVVFHLRGAAQILARLREPPGFATLASGLVALALWPSTSWRPRRQAGRRPSRLWLSVGPAGLLGLTGSLALISSVLALLALRQPLTEPVTLERLRYEHIGTFTYTLTVQPSALYPEGVIGPVAPSQRETPPSPPPAGPRTGTDQPVTGPPVFTRQPRRLDVVFAYTLKTDAPAEIAGQSSVLVEVWAGPQGWSRTLETMPAITFSGPQASLPISVDLTRAWAIIEAIEKETEYRPGTYEIRVKPTVRITGRLGPETLDDLFTPVFTVRLSRTQVVPEGDLVRVQPRAVTEPLVREAGLRLPGLGAVGLSVRTGRLLGLAGTAVSLAAAGMLAAALFLGIGQDEATRIQARYGSIIAAVTTADLDSQHVLQVASIGDLARIAERQGQVILHQVLASGGHRYFVPADGLVYEYVIPDPREPGRASEAR